MTAIVSVYGRITEVRPEAGKVSHLLLQNPAGTFIVQAGGCHMLATNGLALGEYVLVGGQLRSVVDKLERGLTYIEPFYISRQPADLTRHLDTVLCLLLTGRQDNACAACPQNCRGAGVRG